MGTPAAVLGDRVVGICPAHLLPSAVGPVPAGPLPFSAPVTTGVVATVLIGGKPAVTAACTGVNTPPHPGIVDVPPPAQIGTVLVGSPTVLAGGKPMARLGSAASLCTGTPGTLVGSATTVLVA